MSLEMIYKVPDNWIGGVYKITSPYGHFYYGSAQIFKKRYNDHCNLLKNNKHNNRLMQHLCNKKPIGWCFEAIEEAKIKGEELLLEQKYLDLYCGKPNCLNFSVDAAAPMKGKKHSEETKRKIKKALTGRKMTSEQSEKSAATKRGKTYEQIYGPVKAAELKQLRRLNRLGKPMSIEQKTKISETKKGKPSGMLGKTHSLETIVKIKLAWAKKKNHE